MLAASECGEELLVSMGRVWEWVRRQAAAGTGCKEEG